jgi:uncharacterized membrane protein
LTGLAAQAAQPVPLPAQTPVVHTVLFYSPTCPHCHTLITEDLPVLFRRFGGAPRVWVDEATPEEARVFHLVSNERLEILLVDASMEAGYRLFRASLARHSVPREAVPLLIVGDTVLLGGYDIPTLLPRFIDDALAAEGLDWPAIPGLAEVVATFPTPTPTLVQPQEPPVDTTSAETGSRGREAADSAGNLESLARRDRSLLRQLGRDPVGNVAAILVLAGMLFSVAALLRLPPSSIPGPGSGPAIPLVALLGLVEAGYLSYVEVSGATAVCGPVGDCNAVQQSEYARLFGIVPVGVLGLVGYLAIVAAWIAGRMSAGAAADWARLCLFAVALVGTAFSMYLTFLEPFVIGATCAWCLASAVAITVLLWLSAGPARAAWERLREGRP